MCSLQHQCVLHLQVTVGLAAMMKRGPTRSLEEELRTSIDASTGADAVKLRGQHMQLQNVEELGGEQGESPVGIAAHGGLAAGQVHLWASAVVPMRSCQLHANCPANVWQYWHMSSINKCHVEPADCHVTFLARSLPALQQLLPIGLTATFKPLPDDKLACVAAGAAEQEQEHLS